MLAYLNNPANKAYYVGRARLRVEAETADALSWTVPSIFESIFHSENGHISDESGITTAIIDITNSIRRAMPEGIGQYAFYVSVLEAIPVGAQPADVVSNLYLWMLTDPAWGLTLRVDNDRQTTALSDAYLLLERSWSYGDGQSVQQRINKARRRSDTEQIATALSSAYNMMFPFGIPYAIDAAILSWDSRDDYIKALADKFITLLKTLPLVAGDDD